MENVRYFFEIECIALKFLRQRFAEVKNLISIKVKIKFKNKNKNKGSHQCMFYKIGFVIHECRRKSTQL